MRKVLLTLITVFAVHTGANAQNLDGFRTIHDAEKYVSYSGKSTIELWFGDSTATTPKKVALYTPDGYKFQDYVSQDVMGVTMHMGIYMAKDTSHMLIRTTVDGVELKYFPWTETKIKDLKEMTLAMEASGYLVGFHSAE